MPDPQVTFNEEAQYHAARLMRAQGRSAVADALTQNVIAHHALADRFLAHKTASPLPATVTETGVVGAIRPVRLQPEPPEAA